LDKITNTQACIQIKAFKQVKSMNLIMIT